MNASTPTPASLRRPAALRRAARFVAVAGLAVAASAVRAGPPLPPGVGIYVHTASLQYANVGDGGFSYSSGPGLSVYNNGGFLPDTATSFANNLVAPTPAGFSPFMTAGSLTQLSTSALGTSTARAAASLDQGILRATANSNNGSMSTCGTPTCMTANSKMFADTSMKDIVTFHVTGPGNATVGISAHVDGSVAAGPYTAAVSQFDYLLRLGDGGFEYFASSNHDGPNGAPGIILASFTGGIVEAPTFSNSTNPGFDFTGHVNVTDGMTLPFYMVLSTIAEGGMVADFGNTARFSFVLPGNVAFTSASGVFLTAGVVAVPEPETYALLIGGLGLVGFIARRRRGVIFGTAGKAL